MARTIRLLGKQQIHSHHPLVDVLESTDKLGSPVLVLVGMVIPLVPLFVQILTKTV